MTPNPLEPAINLQEPSNSSRDDKTIHPQDAQFAEDSAVTKAEKHERHGVADNVMESPSKKRKLDQRHVDGDVGPTRSERQKGVASIKPE